MHSFKQILLSLVIIAVASPVLGADMGVSQGHDLDALWATAEQNFDTETEDAVLLLESREVTLNGDGTKSTRIHTVVWITSSVGIRGYADLRIPWDTATSELEVEVLRTWMDQRWWPDAERISETAVVHTLPHALRTAHDYTTMRETMLLHDGVELPCIMESVYTITEQMAFDHTDGLMVMPQRDPAVRVELTVKVPSGVEVKHEALNGTPEVAVDNADGQLVMMWGLDNVAPLKMPITAAPERYEPAVVWSTWPDWETVNRTWMASIDGTAVLTPALADSLEGMVADHSGFARRMPVFAHWIDETVRPVHYGPEVWFGRPRAALETFRTGYGHPLDRATLFAALDGGGEFHVPIFFVGQPGPAVAPSVPRLSGLGRMMVGHLTEETLYDPGHGRLVNVAALWDRPAYLVAAAPIRIAPNPDLKSRWMLNLALEPGEGDAWKGEGGVVGSGIFADYTQLADGPGAARDHIGGIVGAAVPGAEIVDANPVRLDGQGQSFTFTFTAEGPADDGHGRKRLVLGETLRGLMSHLPGDVHLQDLVRESPVFGVPAEQVLRVRMRGEGVTPPAEFILENEAGRFALEVTVDHGWTVVDRTLQLAKERYAPEDWPALRALLLEEQDPRHGTIIFE